jgi:hypothetical protein
MIMATLRKIAYACLQGANTWILRPLERGGLTLYRFLAYRLYLLLVYDRDPRDIFIVTYPKSGTTLLQVMVYHLLRKKDDYPHIASAVPWFENVVIAQPALLRSLPRPRILKTHKSWGELPKSGRFIYCVRNPKDVDVSYFNHLTTLDPDFTRFRLKDFTEKFLRGKVPWGSWFRHLRSMWPHRRQQNVLFLQFWELRKDLAGSLERVREFLGVELTDAERADVLEKCSLEWMRKNHLRFDPRTAVHPAPGAAAPGTDPEGLSAAGSAVIRNATAAMVRQLKTAPEEPLPAFFHSQI